MLEAKETSFAPENASVKESDYCPNVKITLLKCFIGRIWFYKNDLISVKGASKQICRVVEKERTTVSVCPPQDRK